MLHHPAMRHPAGVMFPDALMQRTVFAIIQPIDDESNAKWLPPAFQIAGWATAATWSVISVAALATYKPHRIMHNSIGVAQSLTALPLIIACFTALKDAASSGSLQLAACRRLNLGLATASIWSAFAVVFAPALTSAVVRTADPVRYSLPISFGATAVHIAVASLCIRTWSRSVDAPSIGRAVSGALGSLWTMAPGQQSVASIYYATLAACSVAFTALAAFAPFPLATVPSLLGKRLARAHGAWTLLLAVALFNLKCHAEGKTGGLDLEAAENALAATLRYGVRRVAALHLAVAVARPLLDVASHYPAALSCKPATAASLLVYLLAWHATTRSTNVDAEASAH